MSNHSGSYMLNATIGTLQELQIFKEIGKEKTKKLVFELIKIGRRYDCNPGEIMESFDEIGICYYCLGESEDIEDGLCKKCR